MLQYNKRIFLFYREAGKARSSTSLNCPVCQKPLADAANYIVIFSCNHAYHMECLMEPKICYECQRIKGWADPVTDFQPPVSRTTESKTTLVRISRKKKKNIKNFNFNPLIQ